MKIVDLTLPLPPGLKTNPTHPETIITDHVTHWFTAPRYQSPCKGYASKLLLICDHIGTHLDAPLHFIPTENPWTPFLWKTLLAKPFTSTCPISRRSNP